jgi:thymidylate kinase
VFKHPDDTRTSLKKTKELCLNRCLSRTGHRTITTATNATEAVNAIEKQWQALFQDEVNASKKIIEIDITKPISTIITTIFKRLEWPIPEQQKLSAAIEKSKLYERELAASWPRDARA